MRKLFTLLSLSLVSVIMSVGLFSQEAKTFSRWSFTAEYGYNYFDGDINQETTALLPASTREITYGSTLEYNLTPTWGLMLDYYYFPLKGKNSTLTVSSRLYTTSLSATINFTRWIFPQTGNVLSLNGSLGVGYARYTPEPIDPATGLPPSDVLLNSSGKNVFQSATFPVTFYAEYNFNLPLALGLKLHYRALNKDNVEGVQNLQWHGVSNDYIAALSIYMRYKFKAKSTDHLRNIRIKDYEPDEGLELAQQNKEEIENLKNKVKDIDKRVDDLDSRVSSLIPRIEKLERWIANVGPDSDNDGIIDERDLEPNTPAGVAVDFYGRSKSGSSGTNTSLYSSSKNGKIVFDTDAKGGVYFDFDRIDLDNVAKVAIADVARRMGNNPDLIVEIRGYCDRAGDESYNLRLSQSRADKVKAELVRVWSIRPERIIANGKGVMPNSPYRYRLSRRCDFFFNDSK